MVDAADQDAVQGIGAADLVSVHEVDAGSHLRPQRLEVGRIVLRVAVGIEDELLGGRPKAGLQRGAVIAVLGVMNRADLPIGAGELVRDLGRSISAAVVDNDDLEVRRQL